MATKCIAPHGYTLSAMVARYGAYLFEPMDVSVLNDALGDISYTLGLDDVCVVGCAVSVCVRKDSQGRVIQETYIPIDEFTAPDSMEIVGPASLLCVYSQVVSNNVDTNMDILCCDNTEALAQLMERAGLRKEFKRGASAQSLVQWITDWKVHYFNGKTEAPVGPVEPEGPLQLTREEVLEQLLGEQEHVLRKVRSDFETEEDWQHNRRLVAMYGAVIPAYKSHLKQNRTAKLVRMADGSRKWVPNDRATELLKLPKEERV